MNNDQNHPNNQKKSAGRTAVRVVGALIVLVGLSAVGYYLWSEFNRPPEVVHEPPVIERESEPEPEPEPPAESREPIYPLGKLIEVDERVNYVDGDLALYIPRLDWQGPVYGGVDNDTLAQGVGLFDYAQLPGPEARKNSNVSIAGHRDIHGMEFYYIDTMRIGDLIHLTYKNSLYTYEVEDIFITDPYNWNPIRVKDYPCVTLQSCTPIGVASERIFVVGKLVGVTPEADFGDADTTLAPEPSQPFEPRRNVKTYEERQEEARAQRNTIG